MALRVWLPLNGNLNNQGLSDLTFSNTNTTNLTINNTGKIGSCYQRATKQTAGYITSNKTILLDNNITMCCWALASDGIASANGLITNHNHSTNTGVGLTFKYISSTDFRVSCNTGTGSGRTYDTYYGTTNIKDAWHHLALTYDKTAKQLLLYVDGTIEYTLNNYTNAAQADYFRLFEWSTNYDNTNYRPAVKLNDVRIYDDCLSQKQIKEISKGLVAHYKLDNPYIENTTNLIQGKNYNTTASSGWGAHRIASTEETISSCVPFNNGNKFVVTYDTSLGDGGGAGIQTKVGNVTLSPSTQYYYSVYLKPTDSLDTYCHANFLYRYEFNSSGTKLTEGGVASKTNAQYIGDGWYRIWGTFTTQATTAYATFYFFTYCAKNTTYYIGGCQVEQKNHLTPYTSGTRSQSYEADNSGNGFTGTIYGALTYNNDSPRYNGSTTFGSSNCLIIGRPMPKDALTINAWAYMNDWSTYAGRIASCTEGGGWNFEPMSGAMNFALGVGASSNAYMTNFTTSQTPLSGITSGWHMFTGVFDGINKKIYIDGELKGSINTTQSGTTLTTATPIFYNANNSIFIGAEAGSSATAPAGQYFNGSISDFRIYSTALSDDDILTLYKTSGIIDNKGNVYAYEFKEE